VLRASIAVSLLAACPRVASAQDVDSITRDLTTIEGQADALVQEPLAETERQSATHVEERLTNGELFYRLQDYIRASIIFTDIVDNYPTTASYPDALFLLADSLFRAGDYLGARTRFRQIIARSGESGFRSYTERALGRLIEIAIHTNDFDGVDDVFAQLSRLPPSDIGASTAYFRAKALYAQAVPTEDILIAMAPQGGVVPDAHAAFARINTAQLEQARAGFDSVAEGSPYYGQSRYFIGVIYTLREQYPQAIEAFARVLRSEATTTEAQEVAELAHLALGRLYYETDQLDQAIEAYQAVPRTSSNFDVALYEIAWVYIRLGDATRAERALEVLELAAPDSRFIPDGMLLRGNLLLRNGRYTCAPSATVAAATAEATASPSADGTPAPTAATPTATPAEDGSTDCNGRPEGAQEVFDHVHDQFAPIQAQLDDMAHQHDADPAGYFRQLVRDNMQAFDANAFLPPLAQRYASLEGDWDRAIGVLSDLAEARQMVAETTEIADRLTHALAAPNHVAIFADLRRQAERATELRNRVARLRQQLVQIESSRAGGGSPQLQAARDHRRELERFLSEMPTSDEEISRLDDAINSRYTALLRDLARLEVELYGMDARATGIDTYVQQLRQHGTPLDAAAESAITTEVQNHRASIATYREQIRQFRIEIEAEQLQVGVGDDRYTRQARLREEYEAAVQAEHQLGGVTDPAFDALYRRMSHVETTLDSRDAAVQQAADARAASIRTQLDTETARIQGYQQALTQLETEAEDVVGAVTYQNFQAVQHRFYDLVLRADVGDIDVAWEVREEHRTRVETLTLQRTHELQALDDEFREITDQGSSTTTSSSSTDSAGGGTP
jgi:tetratricopeptide (TPR) repeat protein